MEDPKSLVIYWHEKGYPAQKMHEKLLARMSPRAPAYSTITNWIRALGRGEDIRERASGGGRVPDERIPTLIAEALTEAPFHSVRSLASTIKIPKTTIWRHLHQAGYVVRNLRIIPHSLSDTQKATRVETAIDLKKVLMSAKHRGWRYILTGDESWFYFNIDHDRIWIPETEPPPTRVRQTVSSLKRMLTIFWSPLGFPLVQLLPKGHHFDADYFCSQIIREIDRIRPTETAEDAKRRLVLHFDNASPHTSTATQEFLHAHRMKRAPHPPFSPDLAPSDFYLFGKLKGALMGAEFADEQSLFDGVLRVLASISRDELEAVFAEWLMRLDKCIQIGGDYVE
jgi:histone-lysine N-methyltransferase SETMAR